MKKRLIFDIDNTLLIWKEEYISALEETMKEFNINIDSALIDNEIENLNGNYKKISKKILLKNINKNCDLNLKMSFIDSLLKRQSYLADIDSDVEETLKYLSQKYSLVILTNYFKEVQEKRLENAGIRKYFEEIHAEYQKPTEKAFLKAVGEYKKENCTMIGDDINCDINPAIKLGLKVIAVDYFNKIKNKDYPVVKNIKDLKKYL